MCINAPQGKCVKTKTVSGGKKKNGKRRRNLQEILYSFKIYAA